MHSFWKELLLVGVTGIMLSGCEKETSLTNDVDFMTQTATPTPAPTPAATTTPVEKFTQNNQEATVSAIPTEMYAEIVTQAGRIKIKLLPKEAPNTVKNFLTKTRAGFYNGLTFHRVEDWVIQGGDPDGTGRGGGTMPTELSQTPFKEGSVGVARGGDIMVSNDAQFFICTSDCSWLTGQYTVFGEVVSGMEAAKQVTKGMVIEKIVEVAK